MRASPSSTQWATQISSRLGFASQRRGPLCAFFGTSENAVKSQIWIAVSVYVLVAIVKKRLALPASLYEILQILLIGSVVETIFSSAVSNCSIRFVVGACARAPDRVAAARPPAADIASMCRREMSFGTPMTFLPCACENLRLAMAILRPTEDPQNPA